MPTKPTDFQRFTPIGNANRTFRVSVNDELLGDGLNMKEALITVLDKVFELGITPELFNKFRNAAPNTRYYWSGRRLLSTREEIEEKARGANNPDDVRRRFELSHPFDYNGQQYFTHGEIGDYCIALFGWLNFDLRDVNIRVEPSNFDLPQELKEIQEDRFSQIHIPEGGNPHQFPLHQGGAEDSVQKEDEKNKKDEAVTMILPWNLIVFGAPGTGKSYKLNEEVHQKFVVGEGNERRERYERVTFYPTYSYAQFVGTYKPVMKPDKTGNEEISYEFVPGPFLRVLVNALNEETDAEDKKKSWCLVIEEINRANAAAVFGDVFQLLDRKDGGVNRKDGGVSEYAIAASEDVKKYLLGDKGLNETGKNALRALTGSLDSLKIPANMYIWATMNSADQGVFPMDTAFKRRWEFEYINIDNGKDDCAAWTIEGKAYTWNAIREFMNDLLSRHGVNEDKLMGAHFVKAMNNVVSDKAFKSKVLMYLWEDAARMIRRQMFGNVLTYSALCDEWQKSGVKVFDNDSELKKENDNSPLKKSYADLTQLATSNGKTGQQPADTDTGHHENPV